jgi:hypothetical protein
MTDLDQAPQCSPGASPSRRKVVVFAGHMPDAPDRPAPRFPTANEAAAGSAIARVLRDWSIGPGDLCLCGGARGGDLLFAEACLKQGADLRLMMALPVEEFIDRSVRQPGTAWEARFRALLPRSELGFFPEPFEPGPGGRSHFARFNDWLIAEAEKESEPGEPLVLLLWDGQPNAAAKAGTGNFAGKARRLSDQIVVIDPLDP